VVLNDVDSFFLHATRVHDTLREFAISWETLDGVFFGGNCFPFEFRRDLLGSFALTSIAYALKCRLSALQLVLLWMNSGGNFTF
jgi:hypothetical protein